MQTLHKTSMKKFHLINVRQAATKTRWKKTAATWHWLPITSFSGRLVTRISSKQQHIWYAKFHLKIMFLCIYLFIYLNFKQVNIVGAINSIYTNTLWRFNEPSRSDENNFGFLVEKVIVLATPTADQINHYNNIESPTDADKILEVSFPPYSV